MKTDTTTTDDVVLANKRLTLEELRRAFDKVYATGDILDQKLQSLLQAAGLALAIVGAIQIPQLVSANRTAFLVLFALAITFFGAMVVIILRALQAQNYPLPISQHWETLGAKLFEQTEHAALNQVMVDHLDTARRCAAISARKDRLLKNATLLFGGIVVVLLLMLLVGFVA